MRSIEFTPIDLQKWKRGEMFYYFSKMAPTGYSITVNLDVTTLKKTLKAHSRKFYPTYLWLVTKNLSLQQEFRIAQKDDVLGEYNFLTPLYAIFHDDDKTCSFQWTDFDDDYKIFYDSFINDSKLYADNHGMLAKKDALPPANAYTVSCMPWISFDGFAVHSYENKPYYFPSVEAGKFFEKDGKYMMPLSITVHHATTDGYHINEFINALQADFDAFEKYL